VQYLVIEICNFRNVFTELGPNYWCGQYLCNI